MEEKDVTEISVDEKNKVVTTPAYMKGVAKVDEVYDGIGSLVSKLLQL